MIEARRIDRGKISGTIVGIAYERNLRTNQILKPFPANSGIYIHKSCKMKIKNKITNTEANVVKKLIMMYLSIIFT